MFSYEDRMRAVNLYDTGHFALETHHSVIIPVIKQFLDKNLK